MNQKTLPFFKAISSINAGVFNRGVLIQHAIALAISDTSPIPSSDVKENVDAAFNNFARLRAESHIAEFNEITPINVANVINLTRAYWVARYRIAFGINRIFSGTDYLDSVSGLSSAISPDELNILNESMGDFSFLYEAVRKSIDAINAP